MLKNDAGRTDRRTDGRTDTNSYRGAYSHLRITNSYDCYDVIFSLVLTLNDDKNSCTSKWQDIIHTGNIYKLFFTLQARTGSKIQ